MQKWPLFIYFFICFGLCAHAQLPPIGQWREHLSYNQAIQVTSDGASTVFCATPTALFSVDISDNTIERFSKMTGLHETGVQNMQWDAQSAKLIIAYYNSNIDIVQNGTVHNIDAIKQSNTTADKTVYNIFCYQGAAYLCSGLGIIVIDEDKYEVKDTYTIGSNGNVIKVNGLTATTTSFYAATAEGLKIASITNTNLADYRNWTLISGSNGLSQGAYANVLNVQNKIIAQKNDSLFVQNGNAWSLLYTDDWHITNINTTENHLLISQQKNNAARVIVMNNAGVIEKTIVENNVLINPKQSISLQNNVWVADSTNGLLAYTSANAQRYQPNSPHTDKVADMLVRNGALWVASGIVSSTWSNTFSKNGLYRFSNEEWTNFTKETIPALDSLYDIVAVTIDSKDNTAWAGSFGGGLLHLTTDKTIQVFKQGSPLSPSFSNPNNYNIAGLAFDNNNNLWVADYNAVQNIAVRKTDGSWNKFFLPFSVSNNAVSQIVIDDFNQKWIVSPNNGLICFNTGQTIDNSGDDKWKLYTSGKGNGNLPNNNVLCIAKDKNSFIWVGTNKGVGVIQCPQDIFSTQGCDAILPVVQQDNFAGYLFSSEQVQTIAVDGADRKWVGTKNGVWLISPNGDNIIYRFTEDNSPLLNNDVQKITIDNQTGEVFIATAKGLCSFRSTATEGGTNNANALVFPNPVPPGYTGTIAIRGLVDNATVKITELNGRLVYQTRALGGQAIWDGKNYKGGRVSTGVYLVLVSDDSRTEKLATKIVFISK
ncbi:MAG: two-component regulator propeller domain-containing protein [Chitinophagaceae bacterium]